MGDVVGSGPELLFPGTIAVERDGSLVVTDLDALLRINPVNGDRSIIADPDVGSGTGQHFPDAVAVDRDGSLLVAGGGELDVHLVAPALLVPDDVLEQRLRPPRLVGEPDAPDVLLQQREAVVDSADPFIHRVRRRSAAPGIDDDHRVLGFIFELRLEGQ